MPKPLTPNIQKSERVPAGTVTQQPPVKLIPNEPASTVAGALANAKRQVDQAK